MWRRASHRKRATSPPYDGPRRAPEAPVEATLNTAEEVGVDTTRPEARPVDDETPAEESVEKPPVDEPLSFEWGHGTPVGGVEATIEAMIEETDIELSGSEERVDEAPHSSKADYETPVQDADETAEEHLGGDVFSEDVDEVCGQDSTNGTCRPDDAVDACELDAVGDDDGVTDASDSSAPSAQLSALAAISERVGHIDDELEALNAAQAMLHEAFDGVHRHDIELIQRLTDENEKYRRDLYLQLKKPLLADIAKLLRSMQFDLEHWGCADDDNRYLKAVEFYCASLEETLLDNNVEYSRPEVGEKFQPRTSIAVATIPTSEERLSGTVADVEGAYFTLNGAALVKSKVRTYLYDPEYKPDEAASEEATIPGADGNTDEDHQTKEQ